MYCKGEGLWDEEGDGGDRTDVVERNSEAKRNDEDGKKNDSPEINKDLASEVNWEDDEHSQSNIPDSYFWLPKIPGGDK